MVLFRKTSKVDAFDLETTAPDNPYVNIGAHAYHGAHIFSYSILGYTDLTINRFKPGTFNQKLQNYLLDTSIAKVCHNLKFELSMLNVHGYYIPPETVFHDTMIMSQMLRNRHHDHSLDFLVYELGGDPGGKYRAIERKIKQLGHSYGDYSKIPKGLMYKYQVADAERGLILYEALWPELSKDKRLVLDYWNEIELVKVTQKMEQRGMLLDMEGVDKKINECNRGMTEVEKEVELEYPDDYFNLSSDDHVRRLLYSVNSLPVLAFTGTGKAKVDKDVLGELREIHPCRALEWVQKYRSYRKGLSIISGYKLLADREGAVHPGIGTNFAKTGRENCRNPNLQNVSKNKNLKNPYIVSARGCFRARPGYVLIDIDQSGIELRLIIEAANCLSMIELMRKGRHPHIVACEMFFGDRWLGKEKCKDLYGAGKNGHFCLCYGGGLPKFAETVGMSIEEARHGFDLYTGTFPEIHQCANNGQWVAKKNGYIETPWGRKLQLEYGKPYTWLNYYIQGTAAGIIKRGQVKVAKYLKDNWDNDGFMLLTVHDSIMLEFRESVFMRNQTKIYNDISELMTTIPNINVPLEVEWKLSRREWDAAIDFRPEIYEGKNRGHRRLYRRESRVIGLQEN